MFLIEAAQFRPLQKRRVAAEDQDRALEPLQGFRRLQDRMARTKLLRLQGDTRPAADDFADPVRAMADDDHVILAAGRFRGIQHVFHHGFAAHLVQHLR